MTRSASLIPEGSTMRGVGTAGANPLAPTSLTQWLNDPVPRRWLGVRDEALQVGE